jgi:hypothetical protein
MSITRTIVAAAASVVVGLSLPVMAEEGHDHGKGHEHGKEHAHGKDEAHFKVTPPADVKEAWTLITAKLTEAETAIGGNKLTGAHEAGEHMEAAVHTLQEKSDMVAEGSKAKLTSALKQLDKAVDELHHGAEHNEADAASTALTKIKGLLPLVEGLYPPGALK